MGPNAEWTEEARHDFDMVKQILAKYSGGRASATCTSGTQPETKSSCAEQLSEFAKTATTPQEIFEKAIDLSAVYQEAGEEGFDCFYFQDDGSAAIVDRAKLTVALQA